MVHPKEEDQVLQAEHLCIKMLYLLGQIFSIRFTEPVTAHEWTCLGE